MTLQVLAVCLAAFAIGGAGTYAANRPVDAGRQRERWIKFGTYFVIISGVLILAGLGRTAFTGLVVTILAIGAYELYSVRLPALRLRRLVWAGYAFLAGGLFMFARVTSPGQATFVYLTVALFDGFSQVFGQLLGKHQLTRSISPSKTLEGAVGGGIAAVLSATLLREIAAVSSGRALAASVMIVIAALAGDLAASWVKRKSGVKDFGRLLPGHGGVLDRFDSFLVAAPVCLAAFFWGSIQIR